MLDAYLVALLVYVVGSLVRYGRRGPAFRALAAALLLLLAAVLYDSLVDEGLVDTAYLTPFGFLLLAAVITIHIASELSRSQRLLASQSAHLEELVATRTRALREAGQRAVADLERKGLVAEQMAEMTRQFILLGGLPSEEAHGAHFEATLQTIVGRIGVLARARRARLEIAPSQSVGRDELTIEWEAGDAVDREPATLVERELRVGENVLGSLVIWRVADEPSFSDEEQFVELATQYLAVALHRLALVAALVSSAVDDERQRIARELHDSVSQQLYAAALNADALSKSLESEDDTATVQRIRGLLLSSLAEMRALLFELQPDALEASTITNLIVNLCDSLGTGHPCEVQVRAIAGPPLPPGPKLAVYRIAQEALTNALRHSAATVVSVSIEVDAAGVELQVADDGVGFEKIGHEDGSGLGNMASRAEEIDADLTITSQLGSGTTVCVGWARGQFDDVDLDLTHDDRAEVSTP